MSQENHYLRKPSQLGTLSVSQRLRATSSPAIPSSASVLTQGTALPTPTLLGWLPVQALGNQLNTPILSSCFQLKNVEVPVFFVFYGQGNPRWNIVKGDGGGNMAWSWLEVCSVM